MVRPIQQCRASHAAVLATALTVIAAVLWPQTSAAQVIRGTVVDRADRTVSGVVVVLLDSAQGVVTRALTNERGEYFLRAGRAGTFRLRTLRIGFQPVLSNSVTLTAGETHTARIVLDGVRVPLAAMRVTIRSACERQVADGSERAAWDQAVGSMAAATLTSTARGLTATTMLVERRLDPFGRRIRSQHMRMQTADVAQPWRSLPVEVLHARGYVWGDDGDSATYYAPGLDVLMSARFLEDHCLRLIAGRDSSELGVAFEPTPARRQLAEVRGTVWLTRASAELRRMEFAFTNGPGGSQANAAAGGTMAFARLATGAVVITGWEIVMPVLTREARSDALVRVAEIASSAGRLVVARRGTDTVYRSTTITVRGVVRDSASGTALVGATVELAGTGSRTRTGPDGRFTLPELLPGEYSLVVRTPSLDSIHGSTEQALLVVEGGPEVSIKVPTAVQVASTLCANPRAGEAGRGLGGIVGIVRSGSDTTGLERVVVTADWIEQRIRGGAVGMDDIRVESRRMETHPSGTGVFRLCEVPLGRTLTVQALSAGGRSDRVAVILDTTRRFASVALTVDLHRGPMATLTGVVVADSSRRPLGDVEVVMPALGRSVRTDPRGRFRLTEIPVGTHDLVARRVGYGVMTASLTFAPNEDSERLIVLPRLTLLDSVAVSATRVDPSMAGFEANRRAGLGTFLTREDLARAEDRSLAGVLSSRLAGARLIRGASNRAWIASRRSTGGRAPSSQDRKLGATPACYARVYADNVLLYGGQGGEPLFDVNSLSPASIEAVEYYAGGAQAPARYTGSGSNCGVLILWTRRVR